MEDKKKRAPASPTELIERLRLLRQQDWERITLLLLRYAAGRFFALGIPVSNGAVRGVSVDDLAQDAIESVWDGRRVWDHKKVPLLKFLENTVSSNISNLFDLSEVKKVDPWPDEREEEDRPEDQMLSKQADPGHDHARYLPRRSQTPEDILSEGEDIEQLHDLFLEAAGDDEELIRYLDAIDRGIEKPSLIAKEWGVKPQVIYKLENRLRNRLRKIVLEKGKKPHENKK